MKTTFVALLTLLCLVACSFSKIAPGTFVIVWIKGVPAEEKAKVDAVYPVSDEGMINLPFVGKIQAGGLEDTELAKKIEAAYRKAGIYREATVQIFSGHICGSREPQVHIGGEVERPGAQPFKEGLTVHEVMQRAGESVLGLGETNRVKLYRLGEIQVIDLTTEEGRNIPMKANDTIEVPRKNPF